MPAEPTAPRPYAGPADLRAMQEAVSRTWTPGSRWHVGDLAWGRHAVPGAEAGWRTALWEEGEVVAWGWLELPGHLELYVDPRHPALVTEVLAWSDRVATGTDRTLTVMDGDGPARDALAGTAYEPLGDAPWFEHHVLELDDTLPVPRLPEGYRVRAVRADEAGPRAQVHRAAWRPGRIGELMVPPLDLGTGESSMTTQSYRAVMAAWPYRAELDQVVEAPDGTLAASALGWLDERHRAGLLEPVGTVPEHARLGLGSAASLAALHALRAAGATRAVVCPRGDDGYPVARQVYRGLGFRPVARTVTLGR